MALFGRGLDLPTAPDLNRLGVERSFGLFAFRGNLQYAERLMHEVGLMSEAVRIAVEEARARGATRVTALCLRVGSLSGVVPEALEFAFELVTAGTLAEGARLEIQPIGALWRCDSCGRQFESEDLWPACPNCGNAPSELCRGRELEIASIEVK